VNRSTRSIIITLSLMLLASLACGLISQVAPEVIPLSESDSAHLEDEEQSLSEKTTSEDTQDGLADGNTLSDVLVPPPPNNGGPCANTFYPMIPGNQWIYEVASEGKTSQISLTVSEINGNEATLNALYLETGVTTQAVVECQDGAIINYPIMLLGLIFGDVGGEMTIEHVDGIFTPNYETMLNNNWDHSWTGKYLASGVINAEYEGDMITGRLEDSPLEIEWNTLGAGEAIFEAITVRAGEFPRAIKLEREAEFDFTAEMVEEGQTISLSAVLNLQNNLWFEPNIGQLKQKIEQATLKIYGINFPIEMTGTVELVEFRPQE